MKWLAALLLACSPAMAGWDPAQQWCWDPVPGAEGYFLYMSDGTHNWWTNYWVQAPEACVQTNEPLSSAGKRLIFIQVSVILDGIEHGPAPEVEELPQWPILTP